MELPTHPCQELTELAANFGARTREHPGTGPRDGQSFYWFQQSELANVNPHKNPKNSYMFKNSLN